jgi:hypothetical protein
MKGSSRPSAKLESPRQMLLRLVRRTQREAGFCESILATNYALPQEFPVDRLTDTARLSGDCLSELRECLQNTLKSRR